MFKRILITGGCGFVGANLVKAINDAQLCDELVILDNEVTGSAALLSGFQHRFIKGDVRERGALENAMQGVDAVIHLAADTRVMESIQAPVYNFEVNVQGTLNVLEVMRSHGLKRLVNASTGGAILGEVTPPVNEAMAPNPASAYGASKAAAEAYCSAYSQSYGLSATSLRFSNVYGPLSTHKDSVIAAFMKKALRGETCVVYGDGNQTRDFVFVEDLCQGIINALRRSAQGVFQLGSGRPTSVNDIIATLKAVTGLGEAFKIEYQGFRKGEVRNNHADISKAMRELRFQPMTSLEEGMRRTWTYFLENQERARSVKGRVLCNAE